MSIDLPAVVLAGVSAAGIDRNPDLPYTALTATICDVELKPEARRFLRGDCNADGTVNIADATCILNWLFASEAGPGCVAATNTNGDGDVNITDATYLLNHLFAEGPAPVAPLPDCGPGTLPVDAELGCANPPDC